MKQRDIHRDWNKSAPNYDSIIHDELNSFRPDAWRRQILSHFPEGKTLNVLDVGCGPGFFSIILSQAGHRVTGIDGATEMLRRARINVEAFGADAEIMEMDAGHLDFPADSFDLILSRNVTHTFRDFPGIYGEWKRVLKPDGLLLIYDANWHLSATDPELRARYLRDWQECIKQFGSDFNGNTDPSKVPTSEPRRHRLGTLIRPDFDIGVLRAVGFSSILYQRDITEKLWDDKEKLLYGTTPMFEIAARPR